MSRQYKFNDQEGIYFVSFAVVSWIDVFTRMEYKDIIIQSLEYCRKEKGLIIYAYVIMSNHIHLLIAKEENSIILSDIMRDMKKYTAGKLLKAIRENPQESRKEWMLSLFRSAGEQNCNNTRYQFWQQNNQPLQVTERDKIDKVLDYIHNNPVESGWVSEAGDYWYSSAGNYDGRESAMKITSIFDEEVL